MCGKRGQYWEQLSINNKKSKIFEQCGFASIYDRCNLTFRLECAPCENEWELVVSAYSVARWPKHTHIHTNTISMRYMPKIHFNNNSNFSLTHYQEHAHAHKREHMHAIHIIPENVHIVYSSCKRNVHLILHESQLKWEPEKQESTREKV